MRFQIRMAKTIKCKMLPMVHFSHLKQQANSFLTITLDACTFCSVCLEVKLLSSEFSVPC